MNYANNLACVRRSPVRAVVAHGSQTQRVAHAYIVNSAAMSSLLVSEQNKLLQSEPDWPTTGFEEEYPL